MMQTFGSFVGWMVLILAPVLVPNGAACAQTDTDTAQRRMRISAISVEGRNLPESDWNTIVIGQNERVEFSYWCDYSGEKKDKFLFRRRLAGENGLGYIQQTNDQVWPLKGLEEGNYTVSILAFTSRWTTEPVEIRFTVDNASAARLRAEREQQERRSAVDSAGVQADSAGVAASTSTLGEMPAWPFVVGGGSILILLIAFMVVRRARNDSGTMSVAVKNVQKNSQQPNKGLMAASEKIPYEKLLAQNGALRAEIAALRGQIEALQERTVELQKTNKALDEQREKLEEHKRQLSELQNQKDELFAMVVHDIKNPAGIIQGLVELLRSYDLTATEQNEIMEELISTSSKILALAQEVSRVLALESGTLLLDLADYDFNIVIDDVCRRNGRAALVKDIRIVKDVAANVNMLEMDAQKIEEVLDNLISNAVKFSHKGAIVQVQAYLRGTRLVVEVIDNGLGLSEEDVQRAFGRGVKLSAKPTGGENSSGLGLWIVQRIIEAHHGRVWLKSALGKGSTFAFELPLKQPAEA